MRVLFLVTLAVVAACVAPVDPLPPPPHYAPPPVYCDRTFVVSPAFLSWERASLEASALRWNAIATEQFCLTTGDAESSPHGIYRIAYKGAYWQQLSAYFGGADVLGVHGGNDQIGIVDVLDEKSFPLVALHELGHAHGLLHTAAPSIMHASVGTAFDFTPIDMAECQRVGACPGADAGAVLSSDAPDWMWIQ